MHGFISLFSQTVVHETPEFQDAKIKVSQENSIPVLKNKDK
jgi:hypothetical protein